MKILDRLTDQLSGRGIKNPFSVAEQLLKKNGILDLKGNLTLLGKKRNAMTPAQRAIDRAAKRSGRSKHDYKYNAKTNRATLK